MLFDFTRDERRAIIFLFFLVLSGVGVSFAQKTHGCLKRVISPDPDLAKINLNTADGTLLKTLPGVGDKLSARLISFREEQNGFRELEELKKIKGMNQAKYEKIKACLKIE